MITSILMGGMGNQMFQYAMGLAQARRLKTSVQIDPNRLGVFRPLSLMQWGIDALRLTTRQDATITEHGMGFNPFMYDLVKDGDVLQGYWQTERYFTTVEPELRDAFNPLASLSARGKQIQAQITGHAGSCFVHVRRGDYLKEPHKSFHGNLDANYYDKALRYVWDNNTDTKFFMFTDDYDWCQYEYGNTSVTVVKPGQEAEDIYLMSLCKHAIIANSSFSWWGAWLGDKQPNRTVIAPREWFTASANENYSDIVPGRWIKI